MQMVKILIKKEMRFKKICLTKTEKRNENSTLSIR